MSFPSCSPPPPPAEGPQGCSGRYRFRSGQSLDPNEGVHPEMLELGTEQPLASGIPDSPRELMAMQENLSPYPEKPVQKPSANVKQVIDLIDRLANTPQEDQQIVITLLRRLEDFHDTTVQELTHNESAEHSQISAWAVDADRLMRARLLVESVALD